MIVATTKKKKEEGREKERERGREGGREGGREIERGGGGAGIHKQNTLFHVGVSSRMCATLIGSLSMWCHPIGQINDIVHSNTKACAWL